MSLKKWGKRHPWGRWFRDREFTLVRGVDYAGHTYSMIQQVRTAARYRGLGVDIDVSEDESTLTVRVIGDRPCTAT